MLLDFKPVTPWMLIDDHALALLPENAELKVCGVTCYAFT